MKRWAITLLLPITCMLVAGTALALPPSSSLGGDDGELTWSVSRSGDTVTIRGQSPKWAVVHTASTDLEPIRTERTEPDGRTVVIDYKGSGVTVVLPERTVIHEEDDIWDGDTLDIRLGQLAAAGHPATKFRAIDTASGKVYGFESTEIGEETCGSHTCTHVKLTLSGLLKAVGPKFHYWFAGDGQLLRFEGPAGTFVAEEGR